MFFGTGKPEADTLGQANKCLLLGAAALLSHYLKKKKLLSYLFHQNNGSDFTIYYIIKAPAQKKQ